MSNDTRRANTALALYHPSRSEPTEALADASLDQINMPKAAAKSKTKTKNDVGKKKKGTASSFRVLSHLHLESLANQRQH